MKNIFMIGALFSIFVIVISSTLAYKDKPFLFTTTWVSNIANADSPASDIFKYGLQINSIFYIFMTFYFASISFRKGKWMTFFSIMTVLSGVLANIGIFLLTNNPLGEGPEHAYGAYLFFAFTPGFTVFTTFILEDYSKRRNFKLPILPQKTIMGLYVSIAILIIPATLNVIQKVKYDGLSILESNDLDLAYLRILEWVNIIVFFLWNLAMGIHLRQYYTWRSRIIKEGAIKKTDISQRTQQNSGKKEERKVLVKKEVLSTHL